MPSQPKRTRRPPAYWPEFMRMPQRGQYLHKTFAEQLNVACLVMRTSSRGVSPKVLADQRDASRWFIEALYQGYCCLPSLPIALPRRRNYYTTNFPLGFKVVDRVLKAAVRLGFVRLVKGKYDPAEISWVTRVHPQGGLLNHFKGISTIWQKLSPPDIATSVLINERKSRRRPATSADHPDVQRMQRNLYEINRFFAKQCIAPIAGTE